MQEVFFIDRWINQGRQEGRQEGEVNLVLRLLKRRVGVLDVKIEAKIKALKIEQLESLGESLIDFTSAQDLTNWLKENA